MQSFVQRLSSNPLKLRKISFSSSWLALNSTNSLIKQNPSLLISCRWKSADNHDSSITRVKENESIQLTLSEKAKQATKDAGYLGIIIVGIGVTGVMFYAVFRELFSKQSPNSIYSDALKLCRNDTRIADILGEPIKGYGELSSRGRRRHVSHVTYEKDGLDYMRMKFYIEGPKCSGTVHLEMVEGQHSKYEYRYLFVDIKQYPPTTIVLKDNRHIDVSTQVKSLL